MRDELQPGEGEARDALRLQLLQHVRHHGDQRQAGGVSLRVGREGGRQLGDEPQEDAVVGAPVQRLPARGRVPHQHPRHHPQDLVQQAEAASVRCSATDFSSMILHLKISHRAASQPRVHLMLKYNIARAPPSTHSPPLKTDSTIQHGLVSNVERWLVCRCSLHLLYSMHAHTRMWEKPTGVHAHVFGSISSDKWHVSLRSSREAPVTRQTTRRTIASVATKLSCGWGGLPAGCPVAAAGRSLLRQWMTASSVKLRKKRSVRSSPWAHGLILSAQLNRRCRIQIAGRGCDSSRH